MSYTCEMAVSMTTRNPGAHHALEVEGLTKEYRRGDETVSALRAVTMSVAEGERLAIMGPSGGGKSTLLSLIGGLDRATSGAVRFGGIDICKASTRDLTLLRRTSIAFILQTPSLLPMLTAQENIELPLALNGMAARERTDL